MRMESISSTTALHFFFYCKLHIVAQIIKAEFVIGTVGNVCIVSSFPRSVIHVGKDCADTDSEVCVDGTHPIGIAFCKIVVDGYDVYTLS